MKGVLKSVLIVVAGLAAYDLLVKKWLSGMTGQG